MIKTNKIGVYIGRFQPLHKGHFETILRALASVDKLIVLIGSAGIPRNPKNPFTYQERELMIYNSVKHNSGSYAADYRVICEPLMDNLYDDTAWAGDARALVQKHCKPSDEVILFGSAKDESSFYLDLFPTYKKSLTPVVDPIDATFIRELFFKSEPCYRAINALTTSPVAAFLNSFYKTEMFSNVLAEVAFLNKYKKQWEVAPYPVVFVTTDAVVEQAGHVLLITRKAFPGKGLYALPGGFLDANKDKSLLDGCLRELKEETKIELPSRVLRGSIKDTKAFDALGRSNRGRTITHAFYFKLENNTELPKVKASDDAESCQWVDISELTPENMYEDHYSIIKYFI